jgi:UDP-N-acetyl-2-amino-2-deoxyglucuronate dehydrogenase
MLNFALIGASGYIAPRHLHAIADTGNQLVAAIDPHDSVGILDSFFPDARFFTEIERFDRFLEKMRIAKEDRRVDVVSVCSPNYLHDAHCRLGLRVGANVICEKPLVLNPWNLDQLQQIEQEHEGKINNVLQLRLHPSLLELKKQLVNSQNKTKHDVVITYITPRGAWYDISWKGSPEKSGGIATNIGIHLFDMCHWLFGSIQSSAVHYRSPKKSMGFVEFQNANVRWFLSLDRSDLPESGVDGGNPAFRSILIDGEERMFSAGFTDLHTRVYEEILAGRGFGIEEARPSLELVHSIRNATPAKPTIEAHPMYQNLDFEREAVR